jgi:hypothetical protein
MPAHESAGEGESARPTRLSPERIAELKTIHGAVTAVYFRFEKGAPLGKSVYNLFEAVVEPNLIQPTIIYDYPTEVSPLSKQKPDDPAHVERFEFFAGGFELGNAFSELNDPVEQHKRFEAAACRARPRRRRGPPDGRGLRARAGLRPASHRRRRHRHRPAGDAADRLEVDSRCDSVSADEERGIREQRSGIRGPRIRRACWLRFVLSHPSDKNKKRREGWGTRDFVDRVQPQVLRLRASALIPLRMTALEARS